MVRSSFSGRLIRGSRLIEKPLPQGGVRLGVAPGEGTVLVVSRVTPRQFFTYDTGKTETLSIELGSNVDVSGKTLMLNHFPCIGLEIGTMRIIYQSRQATGELHVNSSTEKRWLRRSRPVFDVSVRLLFDRPVIDNAGLGNIQIDWSLTVTSD